MSKRWKNDSVCSYTTTFSWKIVNLSMESSYLLLLLFWDDDVLDLNAAKNPFLGVAVAVVESVVSAFWPKLLPLPLLSFFIFLSQLILYTLYYFCATLISIWQSALKEVNPVHFYTLHFYEWVPKKDIKSPFYCHRIANKVNNKLDCISNEVLR